MKRKKTVDILLPCFNEEKTIKEEIRRIKRTITNQKYNYNIIVCDNNSTDNSRKIAKEEKVKVIIEKRQGYGATLQNGIKKSNADYIVMLDSDLSYNEKHIPKLIELLDLGYDMIIGNRFKGKIEKKAMPFSHRIGSSLLTMYANTLFRTPSHDYHCGLRAFNREKIMKCNLETRGFEFATEMIIKAKMNHLKIKEVPTDLFVDGRDRKPHLKAIRDGLRHLHLINKVKFSSSSLFRYSFIFLLLILIYFTSLVLVSLLPRQWIYNNSSKSLSFFEEYSNNMNNKNRSYIELEKCGDVRNISMAYNLNPKKPIDSAIRMSYQKEIDSLHNLQKIFEENRGERINYSRYWQGQVLYSKLMLLLMPLGYTMYGIQLIILLIFFIIDTIKLWIKDKLLAIAFILMNISINAFFTAFSVQYFFAILLMLIFVYILIIMYEKKSPYIGLLFAISGSLTCFFDFLTCETITLTLPLFIYIYLLIKENKKISIKEVIKLIFLWGIFYLLTFASKWIIDMLYFGFNYIHVILGKAMIRVGNDNFLIIRYSKSILLQFSNFIPFSFFKNSMIFSLILLLNAIYFQIFDNRKYWPLIVPTIIPFIRTLVLSTHSYNFYYFTYRSYGVLILYILMMIILKICCVLKQK